LRVLMISILIGGCDAGFKTSSEIPSSEAKTYTINTIAFYNLENLFDTLDDPHKFDEQSPIMGIDPKLREMVYWKKNQNMARVISEIGRDQTGSPPTVVGVAEIENRAVLEDLVQDEHLKPFHYGIIHFDSPDLRGIDVA